MSESMRCPICGGDKWKQSQTDLGYPHWKADGMKPMRMSHFRCEGCGFIATFAKGVGAGGK